MNHELEIQISSANCDETPVDQYVQSLVSAGTQNKWCWCSEGPGGVSCFRFDDTERGLTTTLVCEAETENYSQYCLEAKNSEGATEMRSVEWVAAGNSCPLRTLYTTLVEAMQDAADRVTAGEESDPDDNVTLTNDFIDALIKDAEGDRHKVFFIRKGCGFFADGFGISESIITLVKEWEDETSARFFFKMEKQDGALIVSCAETSRNSDDEAELRKLYNLLDKQVPIITVDEATNDIRRFVEKSTFDSFYQRVLKYCSAELPVIEPMDVDGKILIHDLFNAVSETAVIRQFLDEIAMRRGPIGEQDMVRLKSLAKSVFTIIRQVNRKPNGRVFTPRAVPAAYDKPGLASRGVRWSSCLPRIANAYTTWSHDLVGCDPAMGEGRAMQNVAVLVLTAVLCDQIP